jgi:hypothetical protein
MYTLSSIIRLMRAANSSSSIWIPACLFTNWSWICDMLSCLNIYSLKSLKIYCSVSVNSSPILSELLSFRFIYLIKLSIIDCFLSLTKHVQ